jgi:hypothetical protein
MKPIPVKVLVTFILVSDGLNSKESPVVYFTTLSVIQTLCCQTVGIMVNRSVLKEVAVAYSTYGRKIFMVGRRRSTKSSVRVAYDLAHGC